MLTAEDRHKEGAVDVELVMQISRAQDDRLSGTVRRSPEADLRPFSGTLELMRVLEDLVPTTGDERAAGARQQP